MVKTGNVCAGDVKAADLTLHDYSKNTIPICGKVDVPLIANHREVKAPVYVLPGADPPAS